MSEWVLDASALLALLSDEPGHERVAAALTDGARISSVNLSEVAAKLAEFGMSEFEMAEAIDSLGLEVIDFEAPQGYRAGLLRPPTRSLGLSLGDRACLALAQLSGAVALTADRKWRDVRLNPDVTVELIR